MVGVASQPRCLGFAEPTLALALETFMKRSAFAAIAAAILHASALSASATVTIWQNSCSEDQVNNSGVGDGSTDSTATGFSDIRFEDSSDELSWNISWDGLGADLTAIHIHGPASPSESSMPHFFNVFTGEADVIASGLDRRSDASVVTTDFSQQVIDTSGFFTPDEVIAFMQADLGYTNIHSSDFPMGEIRCNLNKLGDFEPQTKGQQKCFVKIEKAMARIATKTNKHFLKCFKNLAKSGAEDTDAFVACFFAESSAVFAELATKLLADTDKFCTGENAPDLDSSLDPEGFEAIGAAADAFVTGTLLGIIALPSETADLTPERASCWTKALPSAFKCSAAMYKEFATCAKKGRAGKSGVSFVQPEDVFSCVLGDPKGKIAKACGAGSKFEKNIVRHCDDVAELALEPQNPDVLASLATIEEALRCRSCRVALVSSNLGALTNGSTEALADACELIDDGLDNDSCTLE